MMQQFQEYSQQLYRENECKTNKNVFAILLCLAMFAPINELMNFLYHETMFSDISQRYEMCMTGILLVIDGIAWKQKFSGNWLKYLLFFGLILHCMTTFCMYSMFASYYFLIPILVSTRYFDEKFIKQMSVVTVCAFFLCCIAGILTERISPTFQQLHDYVSINPWKHLSETISYIVVPMFSVICYIGLYCISVSKSGHKLFVEQINNTSRISAVNAELATAATIQTSALPACEYDLPDGSFSVYAWEKSAKDVCGDFYDYYMPEAHTLVFLIADVSDKGVPAALFMMSAKKALQCAAKCSHCLEDAIRLANQLICQDNESGMFLTLWLGMMDTRTGVGKYINAGHLPPILKHADGSITRLENDPDLFLGNFPEYTPATHLFRMKEGDVLCLYTDGISDAMNAKRESFGEKRLLRCIENSSVEVLRDRLMLETDAFIGEESQFDDMTLFCLQCRHLEEFGHVDVHTTIGELDVEGIADSVNAVLTEKACPEDVRRNIDVIIDEICTNISEYADESGRAEMAFSAEVGANCIRMCFADGGIPFNPLEAQDPVFDDEPQIGGLGIYLSKSLSDAIDYTYRDGQNVLTIKVVWNV